MTNSRRLMVGVASVAAVVIAGCDPYSKASTAPPAVVAVTATSGTDATKGAEASPGVWTVDGAASTCAGGAVSAGQQIVFVTFNKQMNPASVQTSVTDCTPTGGWLKVTAPDGTTPITIPAGTDWYSCYDPSSPTAAEGGSAIIFLGAKKTPATDVGLLTCSPAVPAESGWDAAQPLDAAAAGVTSVRFTGQVTDKEGRALPVDVTVNYAPNPGTVRNLTASATTSNTVKLDWTDRPCVTTTEQGSVVDEIRTQDADGNYTVKVGSVPYSAAATSVPQTFTVTGADAATPTSYAVVAVTTVAGASGSPFEQEQATITNVVPGLPVPAAPTAAMAAGSKLPITVTTGAFDPATVDDLDVYRASYTSETSTTVGSFSRLGNVGAGKTSFIDLSAAANGRYVYKLVPVKSVADTRARGADGPVSAAIVTPPAPPEAGKPIDVTNTSITLEWGLQPGTISSTGLTLTLQRAPDNAGQPGTFADIATTPTVDTDLGTIDATDTTAAANTKYWYRLQAANSAGAAQGTAVTVTTDALATPAKPTATRTGSDVTVTWGAVTGATSYVVERSLPASCGFAAVGVPVTSGTTLVDAGAPANVSYQVTAQGAGGATSHPSVLSDIVP